MFVRDAKALCPQLVTVSYDFKAYEEVPIFFQLRYKYIHSELAYKCLWFMIH